MHKGLPVREQGRKPLRLVAKSALLKTVFFNEKTVNQSYLLS